MLRGPSDRAEVGQAGSRLQRRLLIAISTSPNFKSSAARLEDGEGPYPLRLRTGQDKRRVTFLLGKNELRLGGFLRSFWLWGIRAHGGVLDLSRTRKAIPHAPQSRRVASRRAGRLP